MGPDGGEAGPGPALPLRHPHAPEAQDHLLPPGQAGGHHTDVQGHHRPGRVSQPDLVNGRPAPVRC